MTYRIPDNVIQDLQESVQKLEQHIPGFDEWNDNLMHDVMGNDRLAKPVQALLILEGQIKATEDSFGVNAERLAQLVIPMLKDLRKACIEEWRDL